MMAAPTKKKAKASPARRPAIKGKAAPRDDFGAPIDAFFEKQPPHLRAILEELRRLVEEAAPEAEGSRLDSRNRVSGIPGAVQFAYKKYLERLRAGTELEER